MAPRSSISALPSELRERLETELIKRGFSGYAELEEELNGWLAADGLQLRVSKSAIHRFGQTVEERIQAVRETTQAAQLLAKQVSDDEGATNDALIRLVQDKLFRFVIEKGELEPKELARVGKVISEMAFASVQVKKHALAVRSKAEAAAAAVAEKVKSAGLSEETIDDIKRSILGIAS